MCSVQAGINSPAIRLIAVDGGLNEIFPIEIKIHFAAAPSLRHFRLVRLEQIKNRAGFGLVEAEIEEHGSILGYEPPTYRASRKIEPGTVEPSERRCGCLPCSEKAPMT
jgi:hypothetical protein